MKKTLMPIAALAIAGAAATIASGAAHIPDEIMGAIKARKAHMTLYGHNIAPLGGMAKGEVPYDAELAAKAAANLAALTKLDQSRYWPPGSDRETVGEATRALAKAWESGSKVGEINAALAKAADNLAAEAGNGLDALRAALGPVGQQCGACHKAYRAEQ